MASSPVLFLLFFMLFTTEATAKKNHSSVIQLGSWLSPEGNNISWPSSSGHFAFGFYPQQGSNGFAVGIWLVSPSSENTTTTVVWTAKRDSPPLSSNSTLNLTMQGLILQNHQEDLYVNFVSSYSDSNSVASSASMHDSGNFVLYDKHFNVLWQSFDHPTDTILGGQNLTSGDELVSSMSQSDHSRGRFYLSMQTDGHLVAYPMNSPREKEDAYWVRRGSWLSLNVLSLNVEGFLCLKDYIVFDDSLRCFNDIKKSRKESQNTTSIYRATLDVDGNFRLYEHQFEGNNTTTGIGVVQVLWHALNDTCQVKGFCGLNSYCSIMGGNAVCKCYPGFKTKSSGDVSPDCVQTHSKDDCESSEDPTMLYNVTHLVNMSWGDTPYSVIPMEKETCEKSCRKDCDCGGALYSSGNCDKYRLPLMYGRIIQDDTTVALLKIPSGILIISPPPTSNKTDLPKPMVVVDNKRSLIMILAFTLGSISLICLVFAVSVFFNYRRQVYEYAMLSEGEKLGFTEEDYLLRSFSFDELVKSTRGFTEEIGRGSFGAVYSGTIGESNKRIAVKRLERIADEAGEREFRAEITAIARTHHRNLVKLVGFCIDGSRKLLVYEYLSKGSLANLLFEGHMRLSWKERMKIALDVARGLLYLHEECEVRIIHCNINPRNILMDEAWTAKISDFGLARLLKRGDYSRTKKGDDDRSRYLAPEWQKEDASVSVKADIYSFGTVLLEIICRRSSVEMINVSSPDEILLSSWVYQCFAAGQLNKLITHEEEDVDLNILERMAKVGLWCVQHHPSIRPSMKNVILMLEGLKDIPVPPSPAHLLEI